ncbi:hypothetical protein ABIQ69_00505 [Agromyces sp. G08B096]|uniref:MarR family transcriptional regulator n=1 Tax=Agromyces sp. G08B096 TaxID=3156399 RepID=A0AAU7W7H3_9MICO
MTTDQQIPENHDHHDGLSHDSDDSDARRPFGFWLKVVDRRLSEAMADLFAAEGLTRRDWRALNLLAGRADDAHLAARLRDHPEKLHRLVERGWVRGIPARLTPDGEEARERLLGDVRALRERVVGAVSPEDFETTVATLETIARELGWDESQPLPRGRRGGRRFRGGFGHGFGERAQGHAGWGHRGEHGHGHERGHGDEHGRPHHGGGHGFDGRPGHRHGAGRQDVHVHVHLHDGHGPHDANRPHHD